MRSYLRTDQTKYVTNSQVDRTNNARRATNEWINLGVNTDSVQYYNTYQELILLDLVIESDIYDNYNYASYVSKSGSQNV